MRKDVKNNLIAINAMDGKNMNIIQRSIRFAHVNQVCNVIKEINAAIFIMKMIEGIFFYFNSLE